MVFRPAVLTAEEAHVRFDHMIAVCQAVPVGKQPVVEVSSSIIMGNAGVDITSRAGPGWSGDNGWLRSSEALDMPQRPARLFWPRLTKRMRGSC